MRTNPRAVNTSVKEKSGGCLVFLGTKKRNAARALRLTYQETKLLGSRFQ
jgi:hypothetical protein